MRKFRYYHLAGTIAIFIFTISCGTSDQMVQPTEQPSATFSPTVSNTPPINTPKPTHTMLPSSTPEPTSMNEFNPTHTSTSKPNLSEQLNIKGLCLAYFSVSGQDCPVESNQSAVGNLAELTFPEPVILEGVGDNPKLNFYNPFDIAIVHILGNAAGEVFSIRAIGPDSHMGNETLVNTTDPYDGIKPIDLYQRQHTLRFEIKATGDWKIELLPIADARVIDDLGSATGSGDDVILVISEHPSSIMIKGNPDARFFKVTAYGNSETALVNTNEPYEDIVELPLDTVLLDIKSESKWEISIKQK